MRRRAQAEHEVGKVIEVVCRDARRPCELAGVLTAAVERIDVLHFGLNVLELVAGLERMAAGEPREVDFGVVDGRVLPDGDLDILDERNRENDLWVCKSLRRRSWQARPSDSWRLFRSTPS